MPSQKDHMLSGRPYRSDDPQLREERRRCRLLTERLNATGSAQPAVRQEILRTLLGSLGDGAAVLSPFQCDYGYRISIGARTFINFGAVILDSAEVRIGDDVQIGPSVQLVTPLHPLDPVERRSTTEWAEPITVGDDAWLAAGVIVCPGVTIGAGAVIGAGSVVLADMPAGHLCVGNPCRPVRPI